MEVSHMAKNIKKNAWNALKSKTVWAGIVIAGVGIAQAFGVNVPVETVVTLATALGLVGVRHAIEKKK